MTKTTIKPAEMQLGDTVRALLGEAWNVAIVKQIANGEVRLFRPYGTTADFSYTGGVVCYVGIEEYGVPLNSDHAFELLHRQTLK